jgi:hypothetical protein
MRTRTSIPPDRMTDDQRLAEIAEILAAGVVRVLGRKSSHLAADRGDSSLDFTADRSSRATPETERKAWTTTCWRGSPL